MLNEFVVDGDWLQANLGGRGLAIVDCDPEAAYLRAHIPGAFHSNKHPYKSTENHRVVMGPGEFAAAMSELGIGEDTDVVAYDTTGSVSAGRMWWCLRYYGHSRVRVLDGGWDLWLRQGRPVTMRVPEAAPASFTPRPDESMLATGDYVLSALGRPDVAVVDVRSESEWTGVEGRTNPRPGHIPGSVHLEWSNSITRDGERRFKTEPELRQMFEACGITPDKEVITL
jgi:thiosulfate/3-mercaptopyruvate sulfurtransferase